MTAGWWCSTTARATCARRSGRWPAPARDVTVTADLAAAAAADGLVVPGVGAYAACMAGIEALGAGPVIAERVAAGRPVLGICVGMQVLFEHGDEHGVVTKGLGLLPGGVTRLPRRPVPHMGWNTVDAPAGSVLFAGLPRRRAGSTSSTRTRCSTRRRWRRPAPR